MGQKKNDCLGELKRVPGTGILPGCAYYVSYQIRLLKIKYGFERTFSNTDLGLF